MLHGTWAHVHCVVHGCPWHLGPCPLCCVWVSNEKKHKYLKKTNKNHEKNRPLLGLCVLEKKEENKKKLSSLSFPLLLYLPSVPYAALPSASCDVVLCYALYPCLMARAPRVRHHLCILCILSLGFSWFCLTWVRVW